MAKPKDIKNIDLDSTVFTFMGDEYPVFMKDIIEALECGENPDLDQLGNAYDQFVQHITNPIREMEEEQLELLLRAKTIADRMIELAPDFFDKALKRHPRETAYFIDTDIEDEDHD